MMFNASQHVKLATKTLIAIGVILLLWLVVILTFLYQLWIQEEQYEQDQELLSGWKRRYQSLLLEQQEQKKASLLYQAMLDKGVIGEERRTSWLLTLQDIQQAYKLAPISYSIEPKREYKTTSLPHVNNATFYYSTMTLELDLLHEGEMLSLLQALNMQSAGRFILRECDITRFTDSNTAHQLHAKCILDWLSVSFVAGNK